MDELWTEMHYDIIRHWLHFDNHVVQIEHKDQSSWNRWRI